MGFVKFKKNRKSEKDSFQPDPTHPPPIKKHTNKNLTPEKSELGLV